MYYNINSVYYPIRAFRTARLQFPPIILFTIVGESLVVIFFFLYNLIELFLPYARVDVGVIVRLLSIYGLVLFEQYWN